MMVWSKLLTDSFKGSPESLSSWFRFGRKVRRWLPLLVIRWGSTVMRKIWLRILSA